jgi:hypothetical protein
LSYDAIDRRKNKNRKRKEGEEREGKGIECLAENGAQ